MPFLEDDAGIRNNYGALIGSMGRKIEELFWLKEALNIDPNMAHALINLGVCYVLCVVCIKHLYVQKYKLKKNDLGSIWLYHKKYILFYFSLFIFLHCILSMYMYCRWLLSR
jgi:hypothetical protein